MKQAKIAVLGVVVSFWKIRQLATDSDFDLQGSISTGMSRRIFWVVSRVIQSYGLASRAIFLQGSWLFSSFHEGFWKIRQLVTTSDFDLEGLIWTV